MIIKRFKKIEKIIIYYLILSFVIPYFVGGNIAKAAPLNIDIPTDIKTIYRGIIDNDRCIMFYLNNCTTPDPLLGDTPDSRGDTLQNWRQELKDNGLPNDLIIQKRINSIKNACSSLNDLTDEEFDQRFSYLLNTGDGAICVYWIGLRKPSPDILAPSIQKEVANIEKYLTKDDKCPLLDTVEQFSINDIMGKPIDTILSLIPRLLIWIFTGLIKLSSKVLVFFLTPGKMFLGIGYSGYTVANKFVKTSWELIRDLADIVIVIMLFVVAIGIMLRLKEFQNYHALIYLVVVAILLNFTLVICGMLIDISNYFTIYFLNNANVDTLECNLVLTIRRVSNVFAPTEIESQPNPLYWLPWVIGPLGTIINVATGFTTPASTIHMAQTVSNVIGMIVAIILLGQVIGLILYVLTRIVTLWILSIVSPLAAVCYVLPQTKQLFDSWWNYFKSMLINLPLLAMAMYFILNLINTLTEQISGLSNKNTIGLEGVLGYAIMIIVLCQALLTIASSLNVKNITAATNKISEWTKGGLTWGRKTVQTDLTKRISKSTYTRQAAEWLSKSRFQPMANLGTQLKAQSEKALGDDITAGYKRAEIFKKNTVSWLAQLKQYWNSGLLSDKAKALGVLQKGAEMDMSHDFDWGALSEEDRNFIFTAAKELKQDDRYKNSEAMDTLEKVWPSIKLTPKIKDGKVALKDADDWIADRLDPRKMDTWQYETDIKQLAGLKTETGEDLQSYIVTKMLEDFNPTTFLKWLRTTKGSLVNERIWFTDEIVRRSGKGQTFKDLVNPEVKKVAEGEELPGRTLHYLYPETVQAMKASQQAQNVIEAIRKNEPVEQIAPLLESMLTELIELNQKRQLSPADLNKLNEVITNLQAKQINLDQIKQNMKNEPEKKIFDISKVFNLLQKGQQLQQTDYDTIAKTLSQIFDEKFPQIQSFYKSMEANLDRTLNKSLTKMSDKQKEELANAIQEAFKKKNPNESLENINEWQQFTKTGFGEQMKRWIEQKQPSNN